METRKFLPYRDSNSDPSVVQPVGSRYTDCATPAHHYVGAAIINSVYRPGYAFGWPRNRGFDSGQVSRNILCSIQHSVQWIPWVVSSGVKREWRGADHSPSSTAEVKRRGAVLPFFHTFTGRTLSWIIYAMRSRYSYGLLPGWPGSDFRQCKIFLLSTASKSILGPIQIPIQWVPGALFSGVKRQRREADPWLSSSVEVKKAGAIPPLPHMSSWYIV
jgi:hypothetical protein